MNNNEERIKRAEEANGKLRSEIAKANAKRGQLNDAQNDLTAFRTTGDGIYLYRAFSQWFDSLATERADRRKEIIASLAHSTPSVNFDALMTELLTQDIFECIAPIIKDILDVCNSSTEDDHKKLTALHDALRIGKYHAPRDSSTRDSKRKVISAWIKEYARLAKENDYLTKTAIARQIGNDSRLSYKTVIGYWEHYLQGAPQATHELVATVNSKKEKKMKDGEREEHKEPKRSKPPSWR